MSAWWVRRPAWRVGVALALTTTFMAAGAPPAMADKFGSVQTQQDCGYEVGNSGWSPTLTLCVTLANNKWHAVRLSSVGNQWPGMDTAVAQALDLYDDQTDLVAYVDNADPYPDVIVYDYNYGNQDGLFAWVDCPSDNTGRGFHTTWSGSMWCRG